jgi:methionyl-tRNA formyltransferase
MSFLSSQFKEGKVIKMPQDHTLATFAPKMAPEEEKIDWQKPARSIHNQIRALSPIPAAWCQIKIKFNVKRLKIRRARVMEGLSGKPGEILSFEKGNWVVACGKDALRLIEVQLEGKKTMSADECIRGVHHSISFPI